MRFKLNTTITWTKTNLRIKEAIERACTEVIGPFYDPMCSSGLEGTHSEESGHYHGRALDIHKHDMPVHLVGKVVERVSQILGIDYYVENELSHIHIQRNKNSF